MYFVGKTMKIMYWLQNEKT